MTAVIARPSETRGARQWIRRRKWDLAVTGLAVLASLSRVPVRSRVPFNWDAVNYILGMRHFDIAAHQPHPPGNPLYILAGRAVQIVIPDANLALIVLSILATFVVVVLTAIIGRRLIRPSIGLWAAALMAVNPLFWLYGAVALSYAPEAAAGLVVGLCAWNGFEYPSVRSMVFLGVALAASGGLRPTVVVLLIPLGLFGLWNATWRERALALSTAGAGSLLWLVPLLTVSGGPGQYLTQVHLLSTKVEATTTFAVAPFSDWLKNVGNVVTSLAFGVNVVGIVAVASLLVSRAKPVRLSHRGVFLALWAVPALGVFVLVHLGQVGYVLLVLPPLLLASLVAIEHAWPHVSARRFGIPLLAILIGTSVALSTATLPVIAAHDHAWQTVWTTLTAMPARDTVFISATDETADFRLAGYLLPSVHTLGVGDDLSGTYGILYEALDGHSTYRLDPALHACQVVQLSGVRNLVVTGQSLVEHVVNNGQWTRTRLADGTDMLVRRQANPGMTVMFDGRSATVVSGLASGAGLTCAASALSPLTVMSTAGK